MDQAPLFVGQRVQISLPSPTQLAWIIEISSTDPKVYTVKLDPLPADKIAPLPGPSR